MKYIFKIITRADSELIKRVFSAQKQNPSKGYFINLVKADFWFIGVTLVEENFFKMKQAQFKIFNHNKIYLAAFEEFQALQIQHSKVCDIPYKVLSIQTYLEC